MNSYPFSITLNLLLTDACDSASDSRSVVESLLETLDDVEGKFIFLFFALGICFFLLFLSVS